MRGRERISVKEIPQNLWNLQRLSVVKPMVIHEILRVLFWSWNVQVM